MNDAIVIDKLKFCWQVGQQNILDIPSLKIKKGETVFIKGASGTGKTSLLSLIGGINAPTSGAVKILDEPLSELKQSQKDQFRSDHIGFIFQQFNLLPYLSVVDNITLACKFSKLRSNKVLARAKSIEDEALRLLEQLYFPAHLVNKAVVELSVGQQQRVAVARALIGAPEVVIADEPTSALDADTREGFLELLLNECRESEASILFVSHDPALESYFDRSILLEELNLAAKHIKGEGIQ